MLARGADPARACLASPIAVLQNTDQHRPKHPVLLAVDQDLGEGSWLLLTTGVRLRTIGRMEESPLRVGDRVEWIAPSIGPPPHFPRHGERGWLVMVDPMDDVIQWDYVGHITGDFTHSPEVRRVGGRNEPDPEKWLPGDPFGPGTPPFDEKDIQTVKRWLKEAEVAVQVDYVHSGSAGDGYLVRDFDSFEDLVLSKREPVPPSKASVFDVYCGPHFTLRGIVDESFIGRTLAEFPNPHNLWIINPRSVFPETIGLHEPADSVEEVSSVLRGLVGEYVAVGPYPGDERAEVWDADHPGRALRNRHFQRRWHRSAAGFAES